ncbi:hypothetical protein GS445_06775 [Rhodococcus hoagii]|nr:hypothetical protein [Prescottella equi]
MGDNAEQSWHAGGLCRTNPDLFFPETRERAKSAQAVSICMTCPVRTPCRDHALRKPERFGIWGGTTPPNAHECVGKALQPPKHRGRACNCKPGLFGASTCSSCAKSPRRVARRRATRGGLPRRRRQPFPAGYSGDGCEFSRRRSRPQRQQPGSARG